MATARRATTGKKTIAKKKAKVAPRWTIESKSAWKKLKTVGALSKAPQGTVFAYEDRYDDSPNIHFASLKIGKNDWVSATSTKGRDDALSAVVAKLQTTPLTKAATKGAHQWRHTDGELERLLGFASPPYTTCDVELGHGD